MSTPTADAPGPVASESGRTWSVPGYTELRLLGRGGFGEVGHWGSSHPGTINGNTLSFSGIDTAVSGCDQPNRITVRLTVTAWSAGSATTRRPLALSGPYDVAGPATSSCGAWDLQATLTS